MFCEYDGMLVEINPLVISQDNLLVALDGKVSVDDSALMRQPDILAFRDSLAEDELVLEARKFRFLYIPCDPDGTVAVMSNGSGMIMSCIDLITQKGMKVGAALDLGGGATADRIQEAIRIVLSNSNIRALFINIFGGITRCDEVAQGVKLAIEKLSTEKILLVRFEGTNKEKGTAILRSIEGNVVQVDGLREGVNELDSRKGQL
jgi:succinyl-CoA synthetase beta subunit